MKRMDGFGLLDAAFVPQGGHAAFDFVQNLFRAFELVNCVFSYLARKSKQRTLFCGFRDHFQRGVCFVAGKGSIGGNLYHPGVPSYGVKLALGLQVSNDGQGRLSQNKNDDN